MKQLFVIFVLAFAIVCGNAQVPIKAPTKPTRTAAPAKPKPTVKPKAKISAKAKGKIDYSSLRLGDFYYSDGSFSHERQIGKLCVGVVFSLSPTMEEFNHGWTHGQIIALEDAGGGEGFVWGNDSTDLASPFHNVSRDDEMRDRQGYVYSHSPLVKDAPAFQTALNYPAPLPPHKTSGWYLPASGQWVDVFKNVIGMDINASYSWNTETIQLTNDKLNIGGIDWNYWSSTEGSAYKAIMFGNFGSDVSTLSLEKRRLYKVRAVAAF
jgi:hypothetical protein